MEVADLWWVPRAPRLLSIPETFIEYSVCDRYSARFWESYKDEWDSFSALKDLEIYEGDRHMLEWLHYKADHDWDLNRNIK